LSGAAVTSSSSRRIAAKVLAIAAGGFRLNPALSSCASGPPGGNGSAAIKPGSPLAGSGLGLAGIAERVASCGGSLTVGPTPAGGFAVTARLPAL